MKAANKGAKAPAELPEGRASTKGNSQDQSTYRTQGRGSVHRRSSDTASCNEKAAGETD